MTITKGNWVGFQTVFYHEITGKYGTHIQDVIDYSNLEIDFSGLAAYLDYGYCVFGCTPVKYVRYLLPHQALGIVEGKIRVVDGKDTTLDLIGKISHEDDVWQMLEDSVNNWASSFQEDILIPTSGGFDSRLLNVIVKDRSRIHAYTYGTSGDQSRSREVVYAQELSKRLGTKWERIGLGKFNMFQDEWFEQFGCSVGAVGTYHMEFYDKIRGREGGQKLHLLSGIIGDAWAGAVNVREVNDISNYKILGHTHNMTADSSKALITDYSGLVECFFDKQRDLLTDPKYRILAAMRTKMMLLQSLISIPNHYGFEGYSPFIDEKIAISMLNLPDERRKDRLWQRDFFKMKGLLFEEEKHSFTYQNSLNYYALLNHKIELLDVEVLSEVMNRSYLEWVNSRLGRIVLTERIYQFLLHTPKIKGVMKLLGFKNDLIEAYFAYTTIKPIEKLLLKRNNYAQMS